jgi:hypothetical protein
MLVSSTSKLSSLNQFCHSVATFKVIKCTSKCHPGAWRNTWPSIVVYETKLYNFTFIWPCIVTNLFTIKPTDALISKIVLVRNAACFGQFLCLSSGVFHCTFGTVIQVWRQFVCRINSWWWAEKLSETRRVTYQNKFVNKCFCWFHCKETEESIWLILLMWNECVMTTVYNLKHTVSLLPLTGKTRGIRCTARTFCN